MFISLSLILFYSLHSVSSRGPESYQFIWTPKHNMELKSSWLNEDLPCEDDTIAFAQNKLASSYISGGLKSNDILLPDNGVIYMDTYTIIGNKADWQCPKRKTGFENNSEAAILNLKNVFLASEAIFEPKNDLPNIFDPKNWKLVGDTSERAKLHCDKIPSELVSHDYLLFRCLTSCSQCLLKLS